MTCWVVVREKLRVECWIREDTTQNKTAELWEPYTLNAFNFHSKLISESQIFALLL